MRSMVAFSAFVVSTSVSCLAVAQPAAPAPAPAPASPPPAHVELPEQPEESAPTNGAPAAAPVVTPSAAGAAAPMPAPAATPSAPNGAFAPVGVVPGAPIATPASPVADSPPEKPRGPITSRFNFAVNIDNVWYTGKSFDFFSDRNNATSPGVSIGYAVIFDEPLSIVPEIGWSTNKESASNLFGGAITKTELASQTGYASLSLRLGILSFLETHARVAGGLSFLDATVQTTGATGELEAKESSPFGSIGGGFTLHTPAGLLETRSGGFRSVVAGITVEGGYVMGGSVDLNPTPTGEPGRIATTQMPLGTLERSGPYVRTALSVRF
jgi:hypothetical protein